MPETFYSFEGIACTQWARLMGLKGRSVALVVRARDEDHARQLFSRCLLRPVGCHKADCDIAPVQGWTEPRPENIGRVHVFDVELMGFSVASIDGALAAMT